MFQALPGKGLPSLGVFPTRDEAVAALAAEPLPVESSQTLAEYLERFMTLYGTEWSEGTRYNYGWYARAKINPSIGHIPIAQIDQRVIDEWWYELRRCTGAGGGQKATNGQSTCAKVWRFLRQVLAKAQEDGFTRHVVRDPVKGAGTERAPERHLLDDHESRALIEHLPPNRRIAAVLAGMCGLRLGEVLALRRQDIDLDAATLAVRQSLTARTRNVKAPKSTASSRVVPLAPSVVELVVDHLHDFVPDTSPSALLIATKNGGPVAHSNFSAQWRAARVRAGLAHIEPAISTHDLRHYCLTHLAHNTNQLREIMRFAGHSSTAAALRYQHAAASDLRHLAREMP